MPRAPLYALTAAVSLIAALVSIVDTEPVLAYAEVPPAPPIPDEPPPEGVVVAGAVETAALTDEEIALTEEATSPSTTTTITITSTTTTIPAEEQPQTEQPPPPSDDAGSPAPPSPTTSTTTSTTTTVPAEEPPAEGQFDSGAESDFAGRINSLRSSNGLGGLSRNGSLDSRARDQAKRMADAGSLSHSNLSSLMPPWASVAENVGSGGSVGAVFDLLAGSSGHRSNMLDDFTHFGIGVWREVDGTIWTSHIFAR